MAVDLYYTDFIGWTELQAGLLRTAATDHPDLGLDWSRLAGEIEDLGKSYRRALATHVGTVIEQLLKLDCLPAPDLRRGRLETLDRARDDIETWLANEPGLRPRIGGMIAEEAQRAARRVARDMLRYGQDAAALEARLRDRTYTQDQILGDWLPSVR